MTFRAGGLRPSRRRQGIPPSYSSDSGSRVERVGSTSGQTYERPEDLRWSRICIASYLYTHN